MKLLVLNQYYYPDTASTAQRLTELCQGLAKQHDVTVVCGRPSYDPAYRLPARPVVIEVIGGVRVRHVFSFAFSRKRMPGRVLNYLSYLLSSALFALLGPRADAVMTMTDPPLVGLIGWLAARRRRVRLLCVVQDLHPEVGVALGLIKNPLVIRILYGLTNFYLWRSDAIVAISEGMKERLLARGLSGEEITIIPNWADTEGIYPQPKDNAFSREHGLHDKFVVLHSGNVGLSQRLDQLLAAARELRAQRDIVFVIIGEGAGKAALIQQARQDALENILFLPYQPHEMLKWSLASGDLGFVSVEQAVEGYLVPSKVYSYMAAARPIVAQVDPQGELARMVRRLGCGLVIGHGLPALVQAIRQARDHPGLCRQMGENGRRAVVQEYSVDVAVQRYLDVMRRTQTSTD